MTLERQPKWTHPTFRLKIDGNIDPTSMRHVHKQFMDMFWEMERRIQALVDILDEDGIADHGLLGGLADDDHTQYILVAGTRAFTGNQSMGSNKLTNLANATDSTDAMAYGQRVHPILDGDYHSDSVADTVTRGSLIIGNATPKWDELPIGGAGTILTSDGTDAGWAAPVTQTSALLDGSVHTDTVAQAVTRGSLVYGNSTPKWDELVIGGVGTFLKSDGTDCSWAAIDHTNVTDGTPSCCQTILVNAAVTNVGVVWTPVGAGVFPLVGTDQIQFSIDAGTWTVRIPTCAGATFSVRLQDSTAAATIATINNISAAGIYESGAVANVPADSVSSILVEVVRTAGSATNSISVGTTHLFVRPT